MSISVLLISIAFSLIEAGLSCLLFVLRPVAAAVSGVPAFLIIGGIVAPGMLLTFILIITIGALNVRCRAAPPGRRF